MSDSAPLVAAPAASDPRSRHRGELDHVLSVPATAAGRDHTGDRIGLRADRAAVAAQRDAARVSPRRHEELERQTAVGEGHVEDPANARIHAAERELAVLVVGEAAAGDVETAPVDCEGGSRSWR